MNTFAKCLMLGIVASLAPSVWACPMCQEALAVPGQAATQSAAANAYAISIATLIGMPLLLVGGLASWVVRTTRMHRGDRRSSR